MNLKYGRGQKRINKKKIPSGDKMVVCYLCLPPAVIDSVGAPEPRRLQQLARVAAVPLVPRDGIVPDDESNR